MHKKIVYIGGEPGIGKNEVATLLSYDINARIVSKDSITAVFSEWFLSQNNCLVPDNEQIFFYEKTLCPLEYEQLDYFATSQMEQEGNSQNLILTAPFTNSFSDSEWINIQRLKAELNGHDAYFVFIIHQEAHTVINTLKERGNHRDAWKIANWSEYRSIVSKKINAIHSAKHAKVIYTNNKEPVSLLRDKILAAMDDMDKGR